MSYSAPAPQPSNLETIDHALAADVKHRLGFQLFQHLPASVAVIDKDFRLVLANGRFASTFGARAGQLCHEVYKKRSEPCAHCPARETFRDGQVRVMEEHGVDRDGNPTDYVVHVAPLYDDVGNIAYVAEMSNDVTEMKTLREEFGILFEQVPCSVAILDAELRIVRANRQLTETFGDAVDRHCYEVYKHRTTQCPDCPVLETFRDGEPHHFRQIGLTPDGQMKRCLVSAVPLRSSGCSFEHVLEITMDVTETHELYGRLMRESSFRHTLTEHALDAVVATDEHGVVRVFNPAAEELFGLAAVDVISTPEAGRFFPADFLATAADTDTRIVVPETTVRHRSGQRIPVRCSGTMLRDHHSHHIGAAACYQDLRPIKQLEAEKVAQERLAAVGETVAELAHGIKNILTGLQGGLHKVRKGNPQGADEQVTRGWEMIDRNFDRVQRLVKGMLNLSRDHRPQLEPTDLAALARDACQQFQQHAQQAGVTLRCPSERAPLIAQVDREDLDTCLANLLSNAIDALDGCDQAVGEVTVTLQERGDTVCLEVADNGRGMDDEQQRRACDLFYSTKGPKGTGLGLAVTRKLIAGHGGRLELESQPGQGSVFRLVLPAAQPSTQHKENQHG
ncbi:MAG: PAS domain-containing protein [bacterium]